MLIQFDMPKNLNGEQLITELNAAGVQTDKRPLIDENKDFWLDIAESDKAKASAVVATHEGIDKEPTIEDKLSSVGLSLTDLKAALGL